MDKLLEMFRYKFILHALKQDIEQKDGLSTGYCGTEGKYIIEQMFTFDSLYLHHIFSERIKNLDSDFQRLVIKQDSKTIRLHIMHSDATARPNMMFS